MAAAVIPESKIAEIVWLTQNAKPAAETHWSVRSMAARSGVSPAEELGEDAQVGAAGDGQEFGEALNGAEHHSLEQIQHVAGAYAGRTRRAVEARSTCVANLGACNGAHSARPV